MLKSITSSTVLIFYLLSVNKAFSALHSMNSVAGTWLNYMYFVLLQYLAEYEYTIQHQSEYSVQP